MEGKNEKKKGIKPLEISCEDILLARTMCVSRHIQKVNKTEINDLFLHKFTTYGIALIEINNTNNYNQMVRDSMWNIFVSQFPVTGGSQGETKSLGKKIAMFLSEKRGKIYTKNVGFRRLITEKRIKC